MVLSPAYGALLFDQADALVEIEVFVEIGFLLAFPLQEAATFAVEQAAAFAAVKLAGVHVVLPGAIVSAAEMAAVVVRLDCHQLL